MKQQCDNRIRLKKCWTEVEDNILYAAIQIYQNDWKQIALQLPHRNASQCSQRWFRIRQANKIIKNNKWQPEEDQRLKELAIQCKKKWNQIASHFENRTERQVRERYINHLDPKIKFGQWTDQEDRLIWETYKKEGTKWSKLSKKLQGRPVTLFQAQENMIKNRFYSHIKFKYGNFDNPYQIITKDEDLFDDQNEISKQVKLMNVSSTEFLQSNSYYVVQNQDDLACGYETISSPDSNALSIYFQKDNKNKNQPFEIGFI